MKTETTTLHVSISRDGVTFDTGRMGPARARARSHFARERERIALVHRWPGYTWSGWWCPRWLVLGIAWAAVLVLFGLLVVGLFTHPTLGV